MATHLDSLSPFCMATTAAASAWSKFAWACKSVFNVRRSIWCIKVRWNSAVSWASAMKKKRVHVCVGGGGWGGGGGAGKN